MLNSAKQVISRSGHVALRTRSGRRRNPALHTGRRLEHVDVLGGQLDARGRNGFDDGVEWRSCATTDRRSRSVTIPRILPCASTTTTQPTLFLGHELADGLEGLRSAA